MSTTEGIQSVVPLKVTHPRLTRKVSVSGPGIFGRRLHAVLYYNCATGDHSGWAVAGWIKESLGRALSDQPLLAGRLMRRAPLGGDDADQSETFEIVSNDGGVRVVEAAWASMSLSRFLDLQDWEVLEVQHLLSWNDIDQLNPHFSPLFYVQVTNFECGGYAVGISCSVLLVWEPSAMARFLDRWTAIHTTVLLASKNELPLFYLTNVRRLGDTAPSSIPKNVVISSNTINRPGVNIFHMGIAQEINASDKNICRAVASTCIEEVERRRHGTNMWTSSHDHYSFVVLGREELWNEGRIDQIEGSWKDDDDDDADDHDEMAKIVRELRWDDLEVSEVAFFPGNTPLRSSFRIGSSSANNDGLVMIVPSSPGINIIVIVSSST